MAAEAVATERRIIPRPRLTKLLDESPARIKLLVAPAGYGKTTLAQQWLDVPERRDVWYRAGPAAADVAALATGLSLAASDVIRDAGKRMRERIRAVGHPEEDVDLLAELLLEDLGDWPSTSWLAIDDYHFAMEAPASERFIELLTDAATIRMVITSRLRPAWATARRILYGDIQEVDRTALAMDEREATAVLGGGEAKVLLEQSQGWPAVIGLAALTDVTSLPQRAVAEGLYPYFAEEVLAAADDELQDGLIRLALVGNADLDLARSMLGSARAQRTLDEGVRLGVLVTDAAGTYSVHPLLREFLEAQLRALDRRANDTAFDVGCHLLRHRRWDDAFDLAERFGDLRLAERALADSMDHLLKDGRVITIARWLEGSVVAKTGSAVVNLAQAEVSFRRANLLEAEGLAAQAAARFRRDDPLRPRALARAGQSALLASREQEGLAFFKRARANAKTPSDVREAVVGLYFAASELGLPEATDHLGELERLDDGSAETGLRLGVARLTRATREGALAAGVSQARRTQHLVAEASDPLASTSFLHMLANALTLLGEYDEAAEAIDQILGIARAYRIDMPVPHALLNRALAEHGRRAFPLAHRSLDQINEFVPTRGDPYLEFSRSAIRGRLLLSERRLPEALSTLDRPARMVSSLPLRAEYLASQALALACNKEPERARALIEESAETFPHSVEARVLGACSEAIVVKDDEREFAAAAQHAWAVSLETENFDGLVCGYRSCPAILRPLFSNEEIAPALLRVVVRARDERLARSMGATLRLSGQGAVDRLTPRESEVFGLLRAGLTNRAIAEKLVVSEATVKVHIRHIYEKLGVRSRAEALAQVLDDGGVQ